MKSFVVQFSTISLLLLFSYTATSKYLDYSRFVYQMELAPLPLMKLAAPYLGLAVPSAELFIAVGLAIGFFSPKIRLIAMEAALLLLIAFEIYISLMLLSGSHLPCTCGGIISTMGWKQHLVFNAFFITIAIFSIRFLKQDIGLNKQVTHPNNRKILSRA